MATCIDTTRTPSLLSAAWPPSGRDSALSVQFLSVGRESRRPARRDERWGWIDHTTCDLARHPTRVDPCSSYLHLNVPELAYLSYRVLFSYLLSLSLSIYDYAMPDLHEVLKILFRSDPHERNPGTRVHEALEGQ